MCSLFSSTISRSYYLVGIPGEAWAVIKLSISDVNNFILGKPGAISVFYDVNVEFSVPSFLDILLMDPEGIIDAVDAIFKTTNDMVMGRNGIVTRFDLPFIGSALSRQLKAGTADNFIEKVRRWFLQHLYGYSVDTFARLIPIA